MSCRSFRMRMFKEGPETSRRQRLHDTGSVWNRHEIGTDKPFVYTGPGGSGKDRVCYLVPNGSTYLVGQYKKNVCQMFADSIS